MSVDYHRHCQQTVLPATGLVPGTGQTWDIITDLEDELTNLPSGWVNKYFKNNTSNITEDLAGILKLINRCSGTNVSISPILTSGTQIANITIDGTTTTMYAPESTSSYVIERGRFCSTDGVKYSDNSKNDSWYALYSDGWCEQGGVCDNNLCSGIIVLYKPYTSTSFTAIGQCHDVLDQNEVIVNIKPTEVNKITYIHGLSYKGFSSDDEVPDYTDAFSWEAKGFVDDNYEEKIDYTTSNDYLIDNNKNYIVTNAGDKILITSGSSTGGNTGGTTTTTTFFITWDTVGGISVDTTTITSGSSIGDLPTTTKTGYTFDGWYTASSGGTQVTTDTVPESSVTYYAHWNSNSYTITWDSRGGTPVASTTAIAGVKIGTLPEDPTLDGYTFNGWYSSGGVQATEDITILADTTFYAHWIANSATESSGEYLVFTDKDGNTYYSNSDMITKTSQTLTDGTKLSNSNIQSISYQSECKCSSIATEAFKECINLTSVSLPGTIESISVDAFEGCSNLTDLKLNQGVTTIKSYAFNDCTSLTSLDIPEGMTNLEGDSFEGCSSLTSVNIPSTLTTITGWNPFANCNSLSEINVDSNNTSFKTVNGCLLSYDGTKLISGINGKISIPSGVTNIAGQAFYGLKNLQSVTIPSTVKTISDYAFAFTNLASITIPSSVTTIGAFAFQDSNFTSITIPSSVKTLGQSIFYGSFGLKTAIISSGVPSIGKWMFAECPFLNTITIPTSVTKIESNAFQNCSRLTSIVFNGTMAEWNNNSALTSYFGTLASDGSLSGGSYTETTITVTFNS